MVIVVGELLIGEGELFARWADRLLDAFVSCAGADRPVTSLLIQYHNASTALHSLDEILKQPIERPEDSNFVTRQHFSGALEFKDVSFSYPNRK